MPQSIALLFCGHEPVDASVNNGAMYVRPGSTIAQRVIRALKSAEFRVLPWLNWRDFRRCAVATHAAVIVAARLDLDAATTDLRETECDDFPCPLILVTNGERDNLRHLGRVRVDGVVYTDEVKQLAQLLPSVALSDGRLLLRVAICRRDMHPTLKKALVKLVATPLPAPVRNRKPCRRFPRTVEDLATLADVTADYLRHLATKAELPIGLILHQYAALQALELLAAGAPARIVAEYFGYRDRSGVDKLILRNVGGRLGDVLQSGLQPHYAHTARLVATANAADVQIDPGRALKAE